MFNNLYKRFFSSCIILIPFLIILILYNSNIIDKRFFIYIIYFIYIISNIELGYICFNAKQYYLYIIGVIYLFFGALCWNNIIYNVNNRIISFIILIIISSDVIAYFGGSYFGGKKLIPSISPNKTWSGVICAVSCSIVIGIIFNLIFYNNIYKWIFVSFIISISSIIGDLIESYMKRILNIKDTSNIIPGHGGMLDRIDSWILVGIIASMLLI